MGGGGGAGSSFNKNVCMVDVTSNFVAHKNMGDGGGGGNIPPTI